MRLNGAPDLLHHIAFSSIIRQTIGLRLAHIYCLAHSIEICSRLKKAKTPSHESADIYGQNGHHPPESPHWLYL